MFDFRIFFGIHVCYICLQYLPLYIVSLFLTGSKRLGLLFEKMDQGNCIKFCVKNEIKYAKDI